MTEVQKRKLEAYLESREGEQIRVKRNEALCGVCSFRIGGTADYLLCPTSEDAMWETLAFLREEGIRYFVLGNTALLRLLVVEPCFW